MQPLYGTQLFFGGGPAGIIFRLLLLQRCLGGLGFSLGRVQLGLGFGQGGVYRTQLGGNLF